MTSGLGFEVQIVEHQKGLSMRILYGTMYELCSFPTAHMYKASGAVANRRIDQDQARVCMIYKMVCVMQVVRLECDNPRCGIAFQPW